MNLLPPPAAAFAAVVAPLLALLRPLATLPLLLLLLPPVLEVAHAHEAIVCPAGPDRCIDIPILKEETWTSANVSEKWSFCSDFFLTTK